MVLYYSCSPATFLSTLPARGATTAKAKSTSQRPFLSTLPARGATVVSFCIFCQFCISIHAPREGSDFEGRGITGKSLDISIHAPREGSDAATTIEGSVNSIFLSTLPARGATKSGRTAPMPLPYFYPRSPRGERR